MIELDVTLIKSVDIIYLSLICLRIFDGIPVCMVEFDEKISLCLIGVDILLMMIYDVKFDLIRYLCRVFIQ